MKAESLRPSPAVLFFLFLLAFLVVFPFVKDRVASGDADFAAFYGAAVVVREGNSQSLYDYQLQARVQQRYVARPNPLPYYHPPFELLAFIPLTLLPYLAAYFAWAVLSVLLLAASWQEQWLLVWVSVVPVMVTLVQGQDSLLLLFLYALALRAFQNHRPFLAGGLLALGLFKFHLVLPFVLVLLLRKQTRGVRGFAAVAVLLVFLSLGMVGSRGGVSYAGFLLQMNQGAFDPAGAELWGIHAEMMPNARGLLFTLAAGLPRGVGLGLLALLSLAALLAAAWAWRPGKTSDQSEKGLQFSVALVATLMVSYHLHLHDLILFILPAIFLVESSPLLQHRWLRFGLPRAIEGGLFLFTPVCVFLLANRFFSPMGWFILAGGVILWFELRCRSAMNEDSGSGGVI
jgi:hypothetical protein